MKRTAALLLLLLALAPTRVDASPGDPDADTRACVANREANSLHERAKRSVLEQRWEVAGLGLPAYVGGQKVVSYPWCDHGGMDRAWVGVAYENRVAVWVVWWDCRWSGNTCP